MPHSVETHLQLPASEYDRIIRMFIPGYEAMHAMQVELLATVLPPDGRMIDLGGGTGSLAYALAERYSGARIEIWDADPKMLAVAEQRLSKYKNRVRLLEKSFGEPLPECDAVVASLALHHIKELQGKRESYSRIFRALRKPGIFFNGDATMSTEKRVKDATYRFWGGFMKSNGMTEEEVQKHFADWAEEDRYFSLHEEFSALAAAGFSQPECFWKYGPITLFGGIKQ